jgi:hypothetical protein
LYSSAHQKGVQVVAEEARIYGGLSSYRSKQINFAYMAHRMPVRRKQMNKTFHLEISVVTEKT